MPYRLRRRARADQARYCANLLEDLLEQIPQPTALQVLSVVVALNLLADDLDEWSGEEGTAGEGEADG